MTAATALVSGNEALTLLAERAVARALDNAGLERANAVLLFLTPEFARQAQAAVTAAARVAQCLQVAGGIAPGVFTEEGWAIDRPSVAAMVLGGNFTLHPRDNAENPAQALLSYAAGAFPPPWRDSGARFGALYSPQLSGGVTEDEVCVWQNSRRCETQHCSLHLDGARICLHTSRGWHPLGRGQRVEESAAHELRRIGGQTAQASLEEALPEAWRGRLAGRMHQLAAMRGTGEAPAHAGHDLLSRPLSILAINTDGSLSLSERVEPGQILAWAIHQPATTEADMRQTVETLAKKIPAPACALMFSCLGRGPYFYGGEDRDLNAVRARWPGLPVLGVYGSEQIAPATGLWQAGNAALQNAVVTALISKDPA